MIHTFLRSIGFGDLTKNADLYLILESILNRPDEQNIVKDEYGNEFACFSKSFGTDIGITAVSYTHLASKANLVKDFNNKNTK